MSTINDRNALTAIAGAHGKEDSPAQEFGLTLREMRSSKVAVRLVVLFAFACVGFPTLFAAAPENPKTPPALRIEVTGSGRPMILIPGLACGGNVWDGAVAHFKETCQCHVITLPGFAGQPAIGEPFLPQVGKLLSDYIRDQKLDHPIIVGHSLGGFLAFWMAIEHPDQVGPIIAVDGVPYYPALLKPGTAPQAEQAAAAMFRNGIKTQAPAQFAFNNVFILATMISDGQNLQKVAEQSNKSDPATVGLAYYELMITDLRAKVSAIQSPVLLLAATDLQATAEQKQNQEASYTAQVASIPHHRIAFAPKSRHFIQLDAPEFFFQQVDAFLKETAGGQR